MRHRFLTAVTGILVFAVVAVACGGGSSKQSAGNFADATCKNFGIWFGAVVDAETDLSALQTSDITSSSDVKSALKKLSGALGTLDSATGKLVSSLNAQGAPDVQSGDEIKKQI